jgi:hypothetical protein
MDMNRQSRLGFTRIERLVAEPFMAIHDNLVQLLVTSGILLVMLPLALTAADMPTTLSQAWTPRAMRGYGVVSGNRVVNDAGSVTTLICGDQERARLTQAKYLSDLACLPGVTCRDGDGEMPTRFAIDGQGSIVAIQDDRQVVILASTSDEGLRQLWLQARPTGPSSAQTTVPMWLDRWDQYSFRHYFRPWETPKGQNAQTYDFISEFDYAAAHDKAGFVFHTRPLPTDSADGLMETGFTDWAYAEAERRGLPVDVHLAANASSEPTWLLNRYREQTQLKMPGFSGNFHTLMSPYLGGQGVLSWSATSAEDDRLAQLQSTLKRHLAAGNVTSVLEPHGELKHGDQDLLLEFGPVVDAHFREFLRGKYGTPANVATRWGKDVTAWDQVHLPELASFAGWSDQSIEVNGAWKVAYEELQEPLPGYFEQRRSLRTMPAPAAWFSDLCDDATWPEVTLDNHQMFLPRRPAVFRRACQVPDAWLQAHPRHWLYLWDLNLATNAEVVIAVNGKEVGRSKIAFPTPHWTAVEVTGALRSGSNTLAIRLPQGYLAYRAYLTGVEPKQYPDLGEQLNAQWVDLIDFTGWARVSTVRRGMAMIRQVAPDQGITLMAPSAYADGIKAAAIDYGGEFHDTGFMGVVYADLLPSLMRGADLPFSVEPGEPARDLADFKTQIGLYQTEGIQAIDYFIHIGSILYNPQIKAEYEAQRRQLSLMGRSHIAKAEIAVLYSDRIRQLTGFPWGTDLNHNLGSGYFHWNAAAVLRGRFPYDALSQSSFASHDADAYRVIVDSNTSIMDESQVVEIENWIRAGGTFITLAQTGRHTPLRADVWPIARLTGYRVSHIDRISADGTPAESGTLRSVAGQEVFGEAWNGIAANGLHLERVATDVRDLLQWQDGSVAAGARPLGKGWIVQLGAKFTGAKIFDRVEPSDDSPETRHLRELISAVLEWRGVAHEAGRLTPEEPWVWVRPGVTNNGLYDTWTLRNWSDKSRTVNLVCTGRGTPAFAIDVRTGGKLATTTVDGAVGLTGITLEPLGTRVFLTPRGRIAEAPSAWFELQRAWWRSPIEAPAQPLPAPTRRFAEEITSGWRFQTIEETADATPLLAPAVDDQAWATRDLGVWDIKRTGGTGHGVFRRTFTIPAAWTDGRVSLWMTSWTSSSFVNAGRVWLDGREVKAMNEHGIIGLALATQPAGTIHTLAVEVRSAGVVAGLRGQCWLAYEPTPLHRQDLSGSWSTSVDGLRSGEPVNLPGPFTTSFLRRSVVIDGAERGRSIALTIDGDPALISVIINGTLVRRHHHMLGERGSLNLTPFIRFGEANEIELVRWGNADHQSVPAKGAPLGTLREIFLGFYDPGVWP